MSKKVLISVCITTFQHEEFIGECIKSVISQKVDADLEIIVGVQPFDNRDRTIEIVNELAIKHPKTIKVVELPSDVQHIYMNGKKTGRVNFLNTFSFAKGDYVCHLDGDDMYLRIDKLQIQCSFLENYPGVVVASHAYISERQLRDNAVYWKRKPSEFSLTSVCGGTYFHLSTCMYRNIFKGVLPFDFTLAGMGDLYLLMQYLRFGKGFYYPILGSVYRVHDGGIYSGVGSRVKRKRMIRNLRLYAGTGCFPDTSELMLLRAEKIGLVREYEIYHLRKRYVAKALFLLRNFGFFRRKLNMKYRASIQKVVKSVLLKRWG